MIVIISDDAKEQIGKALFQYLKGRNAEVCFISASGRNVKPCYSCGGCTDKTFGKCVIRDDMDEILPILIKAGTIVYTSRLCWGGFSSDIKRILDKTALVGDRFYHVRNGELYKGSIGGMTKIIGVAVSNNPAHQEETLFGSLMKEIGIIIGIDSLGMVVSENIDGGKIADVGKAVLSL